MSKIRKHVRHGIGAVRPYINGPASLPQFVKEVFDAIELERHEFGPDSCHVELQIEDSVLVIEAGELPAEVSPWRNSIYVYVSDVNTVFRRAMELGAESVVEIQDKPYQERQACFRDVAGNTWWVATYNKTQEVKPG